MQARLYGGTQLRGGAALTTPTAVKHTDDNRCPSQCSPQATFFPWMHISGLAVHPVLLSAYLLVADDPGVAHSQLVGSQVLVRTPQRMICLLVASLPVVTWPAR